MVIRTNRWILWNLAFESIKFGIESSRRTIRCSFIAKSLKPQFLLQNCKKKSFYLYFDGAGASGALSENRGCFPKVGLKTTWLMSSTSSSSSGIPGVAILILRIFSKMKTVYFTGTVDFSPKFLTRTFSTILNQDLLVSCGFLGSKTLVQEFGPFLVAAAA